MSMRHLWWFFKYCVLECAMLKILIIQIRQHRRSVPYLCIGLSMPCDFHTFHDFCNILALVTFSFRPFLLRISTCKNTKGIWLLRLVLRMLAHYRAKLDEVSWNFWILSSSKIAAVAEDASQKFQNQAASVSLLSEKIACLSCFLDTKAEKGPWPLGLILSKWHNPTVSNELRITFCGFSIRIST